MSGERIQRVNVPVWGVQMEAGTITSWLVEEGAVLNFGDPIAEIETDKINGDRVDRKSTRLNSSHRV